MLPALQTSGALPDQGVAMTMNGHMLSMTSAALELQVRDLLTEHAIHRALIGRLREPCPVTLAGLAEDAETILEHPWLFLADVPEPRRALGLTGLGLAGIGLDESTFLF